jgi:hypothetical protein
MGWQILWPLVLGFIISGIVQALVRREVVRNYPDGDSPRNLALGHRARPGRSPVGTGQNRCRSRRLTIL